MAIDPYRVLGLSPDSTPADVKRAYRRLAKANHPDSAGPAALPRFLAIQQAYEALTAATRRPGQRRAASSWSEPWRADPTRARSTPGAGAPGGRGSSSRPSDAGASGGRAAGTGAGANGPRASGTGSTRAGATGPSPTGSNPTGAGAPGPRPRTAGASGGRAGSTGPGPGPAGVGGAKASGKARGDGTTGRRRASKKATFGSTTYDEAKEGADTAWSGASWYGPSSGEYWRVNPREYADPRKHGPEYLAKARARAAAAADRRAQRDAARGEGPEPDGSGEWAPDEATAAAAGPTPADPSRARRGARSSAGAAPAGRPSTTYGSSHPGDAGQPPWAARASRGAPPRPAWASNSPDMGGGAAIGDPPADGGIAWTAGFSLPTIDLSPGARRLLRALLAWPPLGIAAAAMIGEATGCAGFEASCAAPEDLYPWVAQAGIILALLAVPGIARILAGGTIAVLILAFPVAAVLSAGGATYDRTYGPAALISVLAICWALGVAAVLMRRAFTRAVP